MNRFNTGRQYHAPFEAYDSSHFQKWVNATRILPRS